MQIKKEIAQDSLYSINRGKTCNYNEEVYKAQLWNAKKRKNNFDKKVNLNCNELAVICKEFYIIWVT